ncbi:MAG TPA: hypothetical protein ENK38_02910 [Gammaproteobacteria bacterium]|nr:hypothetical protein [Gammaproteobacteria bacterium]
MKKNMIALAVAAAMVPGFAAAADSKISGFADITYINADADADVLGNGKETSAFVANAEADFASKLSDIVSVRVDTDFSLATNGGTNASAITGGPADSAAIEQAFFAAGVAEGVTVIGGVFNNPIGWQAVDVVDRYQSTNLLTYDVLDGQTALYGNSIAGVAVAGDLGPVTVTGAVLNDIGGLTDKNSVALVVNAAPVAGLDVELGYVTQETDHENGGSTIDTAGNVTNLNATYKNAGLTIGAEYMTAEEILDTGISFTANYMFTPALGATLAYSSLDGDGFGDDADTRTSVAGIWNVADNLTSKLEFTTDDKGDNNDSTNVVNLRFIAKF